MSDTILARDHHRWASATIEALVAEIGRTQGGDTTRAELRIVRGLAHILIRHYQDDEATTDPESDGHERRLEAIDDEAKDRGASVI